MLRVQRRVRAALVADSRSSRALVLTCMRRAASRPRTYRSAGAGGTCFQGTSGRRGRKVGAIFTIEKQKTLGRQGKKKEKDSLPGKFQLKRPRGFGGLRWLGRLRARSAPARLCGVRLWAGMLVRDACEVRPVCLCAPCVPCVTRLPGSPRCLFTGT